MTGERSTGGSTLSDYLSVLRRRWPVVVACTLIVPIAAYLFSVGQDKRYASSAEVLVNKQNLASAITGIEDTTLLIDEERAAETQVGLAETPNVARRALQAAGVQDLTPDELLAAIDVSPKGNSDIFTVTATSDDPRVAERLAGAYAREFVAYRAQLDTAPIQKARREVRATLRQLRDAGKEDGDLFQTLQQNAQELTTLMALSTNRLTVVRDANGAQQVAPRTVRNTALGLLLGLLLGVAIAFAVDALDTRIRSSTEVAERLGLPLLARLPKPPRRLTKDDRLAMLAAPSGTDAEAFRMLRTNLEFTLLESKARAIVVTSATEREGKSTTAANLAIALARAGKRIALVDLDLRRPHLERFFDLPTTPGITDVALGRATLDESIARIDLGTGSSEHRSALMPTNGRGEPGLLGVLASGPVPPDPGDFVGTDRLGAILDELRSRFDLVLLDSPPLLRVGDALTLSKRASGILIVTRLNAIRRPMLDEVRRLLDTSPATALGFVVTGSDSGRRDDTYGFGYRSAYGRGPDAGVDGRGRQAPEVAGRPA